MSPLAFIACEPAGAFRKPVFPAGAVGAHASFFKCCLPLLQIQWEVFFALIDYVSFL